MNLQENDTQLSSYRHQSPPSMPNRQNTFDSNSQVATSLVQQHNPSNFRAKGLSLRHSTTTVTGSGGPQQQQQQSLQEAAQSTNTSFLQDNGQRMNHLSSQLDLSTPVKTSRVEVSQTSAASPASVDNQTMAHRYVAQSSQAKRGKTIKFHDRFKGKIQMMNKEGHIGVVKTTSKPIEKVQPASSDQVQRSNTRGALGSPQQLQQKLTSMLQQAQNNPNNISSQKSFHETAQSNSLVNRSQQSQVRLQDVSNREGRQRNYNQGGPSQGQGQAQAQQQQQLAPLRDVPGVHANDLAYHHAMSGVRPTNAPANQYAVDPALNDLMLNSYQNSPYQRGQPLQPMHVLSNYSQGGFQRNNTMQSSNEGFAGRMHLQNQQRMGGPPQALMQMQSLNGQIHSQRSSFHNGGGGANALPIQKPSAYKVIFSSSVDGSLIEQNSVHPGEFSRINSFKQLRQSSPAISGLAAASNSFMSSQNAFDSEQPISIRPMNSQRYFDQRGGQGVFIGSPSVPHRIMPPQNLYNNIQSFDQGLPQSLQQASHSQNYPLQSSASFREPLAATDQSSHEQDHSLIEIQKVAPAQPLTYRNSQLNSSSFNQRKSTQNQIIQGLPHQVTFSRDLSVEQMPNPLDFHASYHQKRGYIESAPKTQSPSSIKFEASNQVRHSSPATVMQSRARDQSQRSQLPSLNTQQMTQQEREVAKLKERLNSKKIANGQMKTVQRRNKVNDKQGIQDTSRPSKTVEVIEEKNPNQALAGGGSSEKQLMQIDSGLVSLKNISSEMQGKNLHKFTKRASVNFPIKLKDAISGEPINHQSVIDSIDSDPPTETIDTSYVDLSAQKKKQSMTQKASLNSSVVKRSSNAGRMPISARTKKNKTQGLNTSVSVEKNAVNTLDQGEQLKQTAHFGQQQLLGGTETPRKRGLKTNPSVTKNSIEQQSSYGLNSSAANDGGAKSNKIVQIMMQKSADTDQGSNRQRAKEKDDMQRWRSDNINANLHQKLLKNKEMQQNNRARFTEKIQSSLKSSRPSEPSLSLNQLGNQVYINQNQSQSSRVKKEQPLEKQTVGNVNHSSKNILETSFNKQEQDDNDTNESFYKY